MGFFEKIREGTQENQRLDDAEGGTGYQLVYQN